MLPGYTGDPESIPGFHGTPRFPYTAGLPPAGLAGRTGGGGKSSTGLIDDRTARPQIVVPSSAAAAREAPFGAAQVMLQLSPGSERTESGVGMVASAAVRAVVINSAETGGDGSSVKTSVEGAAASAAAANAGRTRVPDGSTTTDADRSRSSAANAATSVRPSRCIFGKDRSTSSCTQYPLSILDLR